MKSCAVSAARLFYVENPAYCVIYSSKYLQTGCKPGILRDILRIEPG